MTETEWRNLGVQQSPHWMHYMMHGPGIFLNLCRHCLTKTRNKINRITHFRFGAMHFSVHFINET